MRPWTCRVLPARLRAGFVLAALLVPALLAPTRALAQAEETEEEVEYNGNFVLAYQPAKSAGLKPVEQWIKGAEVFETVVAELNETIALPQDLDIGFMECGDVNAFYDSQNTRVMMCYELIAFFAQQFGEAYPDKAEAENAVLDSTIFVFQHELGHALVHLLELPVTGKQEDAVDDLATLVLVHEWEGGDEMALNAAQAFYMMGESEEAAAKAEDDIEKLPYYDEHSLGKQRYYEIACIVYGSDPATHKAMVPDQLPAQRAARCQREYEEKANSWDTLLADYYLAADEEEEGDDGGAAAADEDDSGRR